MCSTRKEEDVYVLKLCLMIQAFNVFNVHSLATGILIKEGVFNVQINKYMIELRDFVHLAQKALHFTKITSVTHALYIHTTTSQGWYVLLVLRDKHTTT